jgi:hypothetical protein
MLKPEIDPYMEGRPWNPVDKPLAMLVDERKNRTKGLAPSARLEMICLREDLEISDIKLKDDNAMQRLLNIVSSQNKIEAAEAYIRNQLEEAGMEVGDLSDKYTKITLADVFADNSRNG